MDHYEINQPNIIKLWCVLDYLPHFFMKRKVFKKKPGHSKRKYDKKENKVTNISAVDSQNSNERENQRC